MTESTKIVSINAMNNDVANRSDFLNTAGVAALSIIAILETLEILTKVSQDMAEQRMLNADALKASALVLSNSIKDSATEQGLTQMHNANSEMENGAAGVGSGGIGLGMTGGGQIRGSRSFNAEESYHANLKEHIRSKMSNNTAAGATQANGAGATQAQNKSQQHKDTLNDLGNATRESIADKQKTLDKIKNMGNLEPEEADRLLAKMDGVSSAVAREKDQFLDKWKNLSTAISSLTGSLGQIIGGAEKGQAQQNITNQGEKDSHKAMTEQALSSLQNTDGNQQSTRDKIVEAMNQVLQVLTTLMSNTRPQ